MLTLSSGVAAGPGRSMNTRTTCPIASRRLWMSQISSPRDAATRSAMAPNLFQRLHSASSKQKKWAQAHLEYLLRLGNDP